MATTTMATVKLAGDGQEMQLEESVAASDEQLKRILVLFYPDLSNADIRRETDKEGRMVVTVVKRAGSKGLAPLTTTTNTTTSNDITPNRSYDCGYLPPTATASAMSDKKDGEDGAITPEFEDERSSGFHQQSQILAALTDPTEPQQLNPTLHLAWQTRQLEISGKLDLTTLLAMQPRIIASIEAGQAEQERVDNSLSSLKSAPATECVGLVFPGF